MKAYFNGAADVDPREGGKFSMLGGMISGTYLEIKPNESVSNPLLLCFRVDILFYLLEFKQIKFLGNKGFNLSQ